MTPCIELSSTELRNLIDEWVTGRNALRDREILKRRLIDGVCFEPLAEQFDLSVRQVKNIVHKRQAIVLKHYK